jgi:outer membrane immunogenic protein
VKKILVAGVAAAAFCSAPAIAADMPMKAAPMAAPAAFSWTGCYLGGNVGGAWGRDSDWEFELGGTGGHPKYSGAIGGGQIGCDYQNGPWVVGLAGMFDWTDLKGHDLDPANPADNSNTKVHSLATATARIGYAVDRSLLYIDGGAAWTSSKRFFTDATGALAGPIANTEKAGWVAGIGWEYAFAPNWSWKVEYDHIAIGNATPDPAGGDPSRVHQHIDMVLFGLNYRFSTGKAPVVAKY